MQDERSSRTLRRILVLGMCLSYLGCLLALWYIWNAPRQPFDAFWLHIGANRFTLIVIPLIIFCACYFKLCCLCGDMLKMRDRQLDERQRMVRDSAHRTAYKIVTLLCLLIPIYLAAQGLFAAPRTTPTPTTTSAAPSIIEYRVGWVPVTPGSAHSTPIPSGLTWTMTSDYYILALPQTRLSWKNTSTTDSHLYSAPNLAQVVHNGLVTPPLSYANNPVDNSPHASLNAGVYYTLVLLTLLIIVYTLPKAIIAWRER